MILFEIVVFAKQFFDSDQSARKPARRFLERLKLASPRTALGQRTLNNWIGGYTLGVHSPRLPTLDLEMCLLALEVYTPTVYSLGLPISDLKMYQLVLRT